MRKKTLSHLFDDILWYTLYLLPVLCFLIVSWRTGEFVTLSSAMSSCGLDIFIENPVFATLSSIFGDAGILKLFSSVDFIQYASYFVSVFLVHLAVDVLLFIPRFAHKCMSCFGGDK